LQPRPDLASTGYCLANPGLEYLVYQPKSGEPFSVEIKAGTYRYEWINPSTAATADSGSMESPGQAQQFKTPFEGESLLYLKKQ
jgi:hypothetical protein